MNFLFKITPKRSHRGRVRFRTNVQKDETNPTSDRASQTRPLVRPKPRKQEKPSSIPIDVQTSRPKSLRNTTPRQQIIQYVDQDKPKSYEVEEVLDDIPQQNPSGRRYLQQISKDAARHEEITAFNRIKSQQSRKTKQNYEDPTRKINDQEKNYSSNDDNTDNQYSVEEQFTPKEVVNAKYLRKPQKDQGSLKYGPSLFVSLDRRDTYDASRSHRYKRSDFGARQRRRYDLKPESNEDATVQNRQRRRLDHRASQNIDPIEVNQDGQTFFYTEAKRIEERTPMGRGNRENRGNLNDFDGHRKSPKRLEDTDTVKIRTAKMSRPITVQISQLPTIIRSEQSTVPYQRTTRPTKDRKYGYYGKSSRNADRNEENEISLFPNDSTSESSRQTYTRRGRVMTLSTTERNKRSTKREARSRGGAKFMDFAPKIERNYVSDDGEEETGDNYPEPFKTFLKSGKESEEGAQVKVQGTWKKTASARSGNNDNEILNRAEKVSGISFQGVTQTINGMEVRRSSVEDDGTSSTVGKSTASPLYGRFRTRLHMKPKDPTTEASTTRTNKYYRLRSNPTYKRNNTESNEIPEKTKEKQSQDEIKPEIKPKQTEPKRYMFPKRTGLKRRFQSTTDSAETVIEDTDNFDSNEISDEKFTTISSTTLQTTEKPLKKRYRMKSTTSDKEILMTTPLSNLNVEVVTATVEKTESKVKSRNTRSRGRTSFGGKVNDLETASTEYSAFSVVVKDVPSTTPFNTEQKFSSRYRKGSYKTYGKTPEFPNKSTTSSFLNEIAVEANSKEAEKEEIPEVLTLAPKLPTKLYSDSLLTNDAFSDEKYATKPIMPEEEKIPTTQRQPLLDSTEIDVRAFTTAKNNDFDEKATLTYPTTATYDDTNKVKTDNTVNIVNLIDFLQLALTKNEGGKTSSTTFYPVYTGTTQTIQSLDSDSTITTTTNSYVTNPGETVHTETTVITTEPVESVNFYSKTVASTETTLKRSQIFNKDDPEVIAITSTDRDVDRFATEWSTKVETIEKPENVTTKYSDIPNSLIFSEPTMKNIKKDSSIRTTDTPIETTENFLERSPRKMNDEKRRTMNASEVEVEDEKIDDLKHTISGHIYEEFKNITKETKGMVKNVQTAVESTNKTISKPSDVINSHVSGAIINKFNDLINSTTNATSTTTVPYTTTENFLRSPTTNVQTNQILPDNNDYVYGVLSNGTVVRKKARKAVNSFIVYGIFPNNTVVKKFPNGTIVRDTDNELEVTKLSVKSLMEGERVKSGEGMKDGDVEQKEPKQGTEMMREKEMAQKSSGEMEDGDMRQKVKEPKQGAEIIREKDMAPKGIGEMEKVDEGEKVKEKSTQRMEMILDVAQNGYKLDNTTEKRPEQTTEKSTSQEQLNLAKSLKKQNQDQNQKRIETNPSKNVIEPPPALVYATHEMHDQSDHNRSGKSYHESSHTALNEIGTAEEMGTFADLSTLYSSRSTHILSLTTSKPTAKNNSKEFDIQLPKVDSLNDSLDLIQANVTLDDDQFWLDTLINNPTPNETSPSSINEIEWTSWSSNDPVTSTPSAIIYSTNNSVFKILSDVAVKVLVNNTEALKDSVSPPPKTKTTTITTMRVPPKKQPLDKVKTTPSYSTISKVPAQIDYSVKTTDRSDTTLDLNPIFNDKPKSDSPRSQNIQSTQRTSASGITTVREAPVYYPQPVSTTTEKPKSSSNSRRRGYQNQVQATEVPEMTTTDRANSFSWFDVTTVMSGEKPKHSTSRDVGKDTSEKSSGGDEEYLKELAFLNSLREASKSITKKPRKQQEQLAGKIVALSLGTTPEPLKSTSTDAKDTTETTTTKKPRSKKKKQQQQQQQLSQSDEELIKYLTDLGLNTAAKPSSITPSYGSSNEAILAALLKEQGIGPKLPTSANELSQQLQLLALLDQLAPTPKPKKKKPKKRPMTTPRPPPPEPGLLMRGMRRIRTWFYNTLNRSPQEASSFSSFSGDSRPLVGLMSGQVASVRPGPSKPSNDEFLHDDLSVGVDRPRSGSRQVELAGGENGSVTPKVKSKVPTAEFADVADVGGAQQVRGNLVDAAINVTRAMSQFLGAAIQTLQGFYSNVSSGMSTPPPGTINEDVDEASNET